MGNDVGISEAGRCRAGGLARILADAGIRAILTSDVARTQQTAEPLARKLNLRPEAIPSTTVNALVARLRARPPGSAALVVGHSNTVPKIVRQLGGKTTPISDTEFDRMYILTWTSNNPASVVLLH